MAIKKYIKGDIVQVKRKGFEPYYFTVGEKAYDDQYHLSYGESGGYAGTFDSKYFKRVKK